MYYINSYHLSTCWVCILYKQISFVYMLTICICNINSYHLLTCWVCILYKQISFVYMLSMYIQYKTDIICLHHLSMYIQYKLLSCLHFQYMHYINRYHLFTCWVCILYKQISFVYMLSMYIQYKQLSFCLHFQYM